MTHTKCSTSSTPVPINRSCFGDASSILKENDAQSIHDENVRLLSGLDETEIRMEREQLLNSIGEHFRS